MENENSQNKKSTYSKRPLWLWFAIYAVIAVVAYGAIYYFFLHKNNSYSYQSQTHQVNVMKSQAQTKNTIYQMMAKEKIGTVMADPKGMTLYTYAKDISGVSNCSGQCLAVWPAYTAASQTGNFPANISVLKRSDGTLQYAWKGMPLYYYAKDGDSGDAYGNGIGSVWSVIK